MKLYYRGLSYELDSSQLESRKTQKPFQPVRRTGSVYNLTYRGVNYHIVPNSQSKEVTTQSVTNKLIYREIVYTVNGSFAPENRNFG